jgi:hypothetical protein
VETAAEESIFMKRRSTRLNKTAENGTRRAQVRSMSNTRIPDQVASTIPTKPLDLSKINRTMPQHMKSSHK